MAFDKNVVTNRNGSRLTKLKPQQDKGGKTKQTKWIADSIL